MTEQQPPGGPQPPGQPQTGPGATPPTPAASPPGQQQLSERVERLKFWSRFGAIVAVLTAIGAAVAIVAAIRANNEDTTSTKDVSSQVAALRADVDNLKRSVQAATAASIGATDEVKSLKGRIAKVERNVSKLQSEVKRNTDDISALQSDVQDLTDRVDQLQKAQEKKASGGK